MLTLVGATTENPSFEINAALLSRCRVVTLRPLTEEELEGLLDAGGALARAAWAATSSLAPEARALFARFAYGDARRALNALEVAAAAVRLAGRPEILPADAEEAMQHRPLLYDKEGEEHYNVVSAFIKSLRGSDPDAAVYYLTRMLEAGEEPRFVLRRMVIFASEDVGNADPRALSVAVDALQAVELVGLPEGVLPMSQAAVYLALAPKSNAALTAYAAARKLVRERGSLPVPLKLRNAPTGLMEKLGYGGGYRYPHDFEGSYVPERYLPEALRRPGAGEALHERPGGASCRPGWRRCGPGPAERSERHDPLPARLRLRARLHQGHRPGAPLRGRWGCPCTAPISRRVKTASSARRPSPCSPRRSGWWPRCAPASSWAARWAAGWRRWRPRATRPSSGWCCWRPPSASTSAGRRASRPRRSDAGASRACPCSTTPPAASARLGWAFLEDAAKLPAFPMVKRPGPVHRRGARRGGAARGRARLRGAHAAGAARHPRRRPRADRLGGPHLRGGEGVPRVAPHPPFPPLPGEGGCGTRDSPSPRRGGWQDA